MKKRRNPERGASLLEYALLVTLLAVIAMAGVSEVGIGTYLAFEGAGYALLTGSTEGTAD